MSLHEQLRRTLDDGRLSRGEKRALAEVLADLDPDGRRAPELRHTAFAVAREAAGDRPPVEVLEWLEAVVRLIAQREPGPREHARAYFSPGDDCRKAIERELSHAQRAIAICVFTITDDRISEAIAKTHARGVAVRIISDDDKAHDLGSDVRRLAGLGIPVRVDHSDAHMHHKFAIFDEARVLTGSYNWTRSAGAENHENIVITDDLRLVRAFADRFERLWAAL